MNEADTHGHIATATIEALVHHRRSTCERVLGEVLAASAHDGSGDLPPLENAGSLALDPAAFCWKLAALSLEDRAVALVETWLDDPQLAPARRERLIGLLSAIPGYWTFKELDDESTEKLVGQSETRTPRSSPRVLGFVLEILTLAGDVSERDRLLHG